MPSLSFGGIRIPYQSANLRLEKFDEFVIERGITALWEKAVICPCQELNGLPAPRCRNCYGRGYTYRPGTSVPIVFTDLESYPQFAEPGLWVFGSAYVTTLSTVILGLRDRLVFSAYESVYLETFRIQGSQHTIPTREIRNVEILAYEHPTTGQFTILQEGQDYTREGNTFTFRISLPLDTLCTIRYQGPVIYVVVNFLHEIRGVRDHQGREYRLPSQYLVQREDLVVMGKQSVIQSLP